MSTLTARPDDVREAPCPKRLWVMMELADDEAQRPDDGLATGLRFHLSRCPSCRILAAQLGHVTGGLSGLADVEPSAELFERAQAQALAALQRGDAPRFEGDSHDDLNGLEESSIRSQGRWVRWGRRVLAVAAGVALVTTGWGLHAWYAGSAQFTASSNLDRWYIPSGEFAREVDVVKGGDADSAELLGPVNYGDDASTQDAYVQIDDDGSMRLCRFRSHEEAALCDDPNCIPAAMVLPGPPQRGSRPTSAFDKSTRTLSTSPASERR